MCIRDRATRDAIDQQISDTKKDYKKQLDDLAAENASAVAKLNEGLSTGLQSLVEQAGQIGEDIVGNLIAGIQKAGTGGTLLDVNVTPNGSTASGTADGYKRQELRLLWVDRNTISCSPLEQLKQSRKPVIRH